MHFQIVIIYNKLIYQSKYKFYIKRHFKVVKVLKVLIYQNNFKEFMDKLLKVVVNYNKLILTIS